MPLIRRLRDTFSPRRRLGFHFIWASPREEAVRICGLLRGISLHLPLIRRLRDTFSHGRRLEFRSHLQGEGLFAVLPVWASPRGEGLNFVLTRKEKAYWRFFCRTVSTKGGLGYIRLQNEIANDILRLRAVSFLYTLSSIRQR